MSIQTIPVDDRTSGQRRQPVPSKRRGEGRAGWGLTDPVPDLLRAVPDRADGVRHHHELLQQQPGAQRAGRLRRPGQLHAGADELRFLAVDVAHRAVHADDDAAAGRPRPGAGHIHRPAQARALVLPAGVLRPVRRPVGRDGADLDLALHPADRAVGQVAVRRRHQQPAELAGRPQLGDGLRRAGDRVVDTGLQLRAVPGRPAGDPPGACTRRPRSTGRAGGTSCAASRSRC